MVYCRRSNTFAVTIGPVRWKKSDLGEWFVNSNEFLEVAIGEEKYSSVVDCDSGELVDDPVGRHQHIFLRSADKLFFKDVTAMVELFLDLVEEEVRPSINTVACRSAVHWLRYLSKEDSHPFLFNIPVSKLSLYARAWHHAKTTYRTIRPVDQADPFLIGLGFHRRFALDIIEEHIKQMRDRVNINRPRFFINTHCEQVNNFIGFFYNDNKHLYLQGAPGFGKTELVDALLAGKKYYKFNDINDFVFGNLHEGFDFIWFEDFDYFKWEKYSSTVLSLMDGKQVNIRQKYLADRVLSISARFIFTSNFFVSTTPDFFQRRVIDCSWNHSAVDCTCGQPPVVEDVIIPVNDSFDQFLRAMENEHHSVETLLGL